MDGLGRLVEVARRKRGSSSWRNLLAFEAWPGMAEASEQAQASQWCCGVDGAVDCCSFGVSGQ